MSHTIIIDGNTFPIIIRKHPRSRRMVIRYQPIQRKIGLTLPRYISVKQGLHFVEEKRSWLTRQIAEHQSDVPLMDGQVIPVLGKDYTLCHVGGRGVVTMEENRIMIPGDNLFLKRRVLEWMKRELRKTIMQLANEKAECIGKRIGKISLRDTTSRWGSCNHNGNLSFSWRLLFAPFEVLDYVVSHEVAHIKHLDHSTAFWSAVESLCPDYQSYRDWLKTHGTTLYRFG